MNIPRPPCDQRGFIHKKLLGVVSKVSSFIPGPAGGIISGITGQLSRRQGRPTPTRSATARVTMLSQQEKENGKALKFPTLGVAGRAGDICIPPFRRAPDGTCKLFIGDRPGPNGDFEMGDPVAGQYGAAFEPGSRVIDRAVCGRGMQLGNDGFCYNSGAISNKQRMWPAGRKPLLTGGEMRAISVAARAGKRVEGATKRLRKLGMMKKAPVSRTAPAGHKAKLTHA